MDSLYRSGGMVVAPKNLLDPNENDLIPNEWDLDELRKSDLFPRDDGNANPEGLLDPDENDLIPRDGLPPARKKTGDLLEFLTEAAGGGHSCKRVQVDLGNGLQASSCPSGGLSVFKDGAQVFSIDGLSAEDQKVIREIRERYKGKDIE